MTAHTITQLHAFEDEHWSRGDQKLAWRHRIAQELVEGGTVLDVGGGDGLFLSLLSKRPDVTKTKLLDYSPRAVEKARAKGIDAIEFDLAQPLPFADNSFDVACALDTLEHLYHPAKTLREMGRVARSVVITVPNFHYLMGRFDMAIGRIPFQCRPRRGHVHWFNIPVLRGVVADAGLVVESLKTEGFQRVGPVGGLLARVHPNLFAISLAVRLVKR